MLGKLKLRSQIEALQSVFLPIYVPTIFFLILVWLATKTTHVAAYYLIADPTEITKQPPYTGILSNMGIVLWSASVAICWLSAGLIDKGIKQAKQWKSFFVSSGIITAALLFDDLLQLHEQSHFFLNFIEQDSAELVVFGIYGSLLLTYFIKFRQVLSKTDFVILLLALLFFILSLFFDMLHEKMLWEEAAKFLGIGSWLAYFVRTCSIRLRYNNK